MQENELNYYEKIGNWDFSQIKCKTEDLTNWNYWEKIKENTNEKSLCLDLGTGGGEKALKNYPNVGMLIATDFSEEMIKTAKENGCLISFDPNLRPPLWESLELARTQMEYGFANCDILKISDNEIQFVSGKEDYDEGIQYLIDKYNIPLILLTMGADGSRAYYKGQKVEQAGFEVDTIETTGAGDTFCGSALNYILEHDLQNLSETELAEMLKISNAAAALVTTKKGALKSMPEKEEINYLIH